ncbi:hypothetical protein EAH89_19565 [Roseomonas nepalensis]|uniref:ATP-binding protein n=1 Tax=Muricoccus nepalensis TaxID=1854500 RepID=A0A502FQW1_9PROT|nr:hypothetical protein [Roseomonas nepalensis]TPG51801.1 hypothetical protein EAH89_19565 [Roseomonas nepalensis]
MATREELRKLYKDLRPDVPLEPGSEFYEPIYTEHPELGLEDPVSRMATLVEFDGIESVRLFSGFRGSGKTTELKRLKRDLEADGYVVLYADALDYVNAVEPIDIAELLLALAGAFGEAVEREFGKDIHRESIWDRTLRFLRTDVAATEVALKAEVGVPGALKVGADLKFALRAASSFKLKLQQLLASRLRELKEDVDAFFEEGVKAIRASRGRDVRIVFIFDSLEQLRGTLQNEQAVIQSVERVFASHFDTLRFPYIHTVYTVPPWLKFVLPNTVQITLLSTVHLWNNDEARSHCKPAWDAFRSAVRRRFGDAGAAVLFGDDHAQQIDRLIGCCGGHFRDLLRLLQDTVVRATSSLAGDPAARVTEAINAARRDFLPVAVEDARWLARIGEHRETLLPDTDAETVNRLTRFLDCHAVLYFVNGDEWYDTHPLIRQEVADVVAKNPVQRD